MAIMIYFNMFIILVLFYIIVLFFVGMYLFSVLETIVSLILKGYKASKVKLLAHLSTVFVVTLLIFISSDIVKGNSILTARLYDDLFNYTLVFREGEDCEMNIIGMFAYQEDIKGRYFQKGDTIVFTEKPYNNNFILDTILIDRQAKALFLYRDSIRCFTRKKREELLL